MYEIIESKNYCNQTIYSLIIDGIYFSSVKQSTIDIFNKKGIALNDSEAIQKYMKYNNL